MNLKLIRKGGVVGYLWILPAFLYIILMMGYPIIFNIILSFQDVTTTTLLNPVKEFIGLKNFFDVIKDPVFRKVIENSFVFTVGCIFFQFTIGLVLAMLFNMNFPLAGSMRGVLLITLMVPTVVVSIIFRWLLSGDFGLINELLMQVGLLDKAIAWLAEPKMALGGVMLANIWIGIPFNTMILAPSIASISSTLYEAAAIDGAGQVKKFIYITLPLLRPTILIVLVLGFIYTFRIFGLIYAMTGGGPINSTNLLPIQAYKLSFSFFNFGQGAAAIGILLSILLLIIFVYLTLVSREEVME